jgi:hypothetical protein
MIASISSPKPRIDALRGVVRPSAISPRPIPCPEISPTARIEGER